MKLHGAAKRSRRAAAEPEVHFVGLLKGLAGFDGDNAFASFEVRAGETWECVGGERAGQTQVDYPIDADAIWNHPVDLHYYTTTLQVRTGPFVASRARSRQNSSWNGAGTAVDGPPRARDGLRGALDGAGGAGAHVRLPYSVAASKSV
jgi:hypothetical protein